MSPAAHKIYDLLPAFHRMRDAEAGFPLRALLTLIGEQVDVVEADIDQQYSNWFIETCADWAVPYIGDLVGYRPVVAAGRASDADSPEAHLLNAAITPRAEVANLLSFRRRKGTLALLELLGNAVADWPARAVEFYTLLGWTQHVGHVRMNRGRLADLRDSAALAQINGPFDRLAHSVDVRRINSKRSVGRYNIPSVGLFSWRLKSYSVTGTPAYCVEGEGTHCYTFSILGNDSPLHRRAVPEDQPTHIAQEANLPVPISRRVIEQAVTRQQLEQCSLHEQCRRAWEQIDSRHPTVTQVSDALYGSGKSIAIHAPDWPEKNSPQPVPAHLIVPANLSNWRHRAKRNQILLDPQSGRLVFPVRQTPRKGVYVDYLYGFSADIGGGEYHRPLSQPADSRLYNDKDAQGAACLLYPVSKLEWTKGAFKSINSALERWRADQAKTKDGGPKAAVIEIQDSGAYTEQIRIELEAGEYLQIRAADRTRPVIRLLDYMADGPDAFTVTGKAGSRLVLDGLLIAGRGIQISGPDRNDAESYGQGDLCDVTVRHSTLVPGWGLTCDCEPKRPGEPSITLSDSNAHIIIAHSIIGAIHVTADEVQSDPVVVSVSDSILDATSNERTAIGATNLPFAFAKVSFARCTIFGRVEAHAISIAENTIFGGVIRVARRQLGCIRYCYVPQGSRIPRRNHCQPDGVIHKTGAHPEIEAMRVRPHFTSVRYGDPAYAQLSRRCAPEITCGADDESEMGAFHNLYQPQREANLRARLTEFSPAGMDAAILFAN
jgi:hypothetical protein